MQHTKNSFTLCFISEFQPHSKQNKKRIKRKQNNNKTLVRESIKSKLVKVVNELLEIKNAKELSK